MRRPSWLRWPWPRNGHDAHDARERAEEALRLAHRQAPVVRREAAKPLPPDEFVNRVRQAFR